MEVTVTLHRQALDQRLERSCPALPVRAVGFGRDGLNELLAERFPVTAERVIDDCGRECEYRALPWCVESQLAVSAGQVQL